MIDTGFNAIVCWRLPDVRTRDVEIKQTKLDQAKFLMQVFVRVM